MEAYRGCAHGCLWCRTKASGISTKITVILIQARPAHVRLFVCSHHLTKSWTLSRGGVNVTKLHFLVKNAFSWKPKNLSKSTVRIGNVSLVQNSTKHPQRASEVSEEDSCKNHSKFRGFFGLMTYRPTQSIIYVLLQVNRFQKIDLLIAQYKYSKSCSNILFSRIWSSAQDYAGLGLLLNLGVFLISNWQKSVRRKWFVLVVCTSFEKAFRRGRPLNILHDS